MAAGGDPTRDSLDERERGEALIELGATSLAGLTSAGAGLLFGPPGVLIGAASAPAMSRLLRWAGRELSSRLLSPNEERRIGTALMVALGRIEQRTQAGETPRRDGAFDLDADPAGLLEGALLTAARSHEDKKVPFAGAFYASFAFADDVSPDDAQYLLRVFDRLTYRQLAALAFLTSDARAEERIQIFTAADEEGSHTSASLTAELNDLANLGLIGYAQDGGWVANPTSTLGDGRMTANSLDRTVATSLGQTMVRLAELGDVPASDQDSVADAYRGTPTRWNPPARP